MTFNKKDIKLILSDVLDCSTESITDTVPLADLGFDSLRFISAVVKIESKYDIEILDSDLLFNNFKDVLSICGTLKKYFEAELTIYKCIITDCDGVLWHGISGESGDEKAIIDESTNRFCALLHSLRKKGVLLAICSKNERQNIEAMLNNTPINSDDFAIIETNVESKVDSISYILSEFGFTADNAIYVDDSNAELEYIKSKIPTLTMVKADYIDTFTDEISSMFAFQSESNVIDRTALFNKQKERERIHHQTSSPDEYNRILETKTVCEKATVQDFSRLAELSHRANRFNLTGARYTAENIEQIQGDNQYSVYKLCAEDKFGDMGLVVMAVVHKNMIESFIMSCRVFGRGFEIEMLNKIKSDCGDEIKGIYLPTGKNNYCKDFYIENGVSYELCRYDRKNPEDSAG